MENRINTVDEITTCFAWNTRWYLILPKYGNRVELFEFKREKRKFVQFEKLNQIQSVSISSHQSDLMDFRLKHCEN